MKHFSIKNTVLATLFVAVSSLTSCRNEFDFERAHNGENFSDKKEEFKESFETAFCNGVEICPTHTWGFEELESEEALMNGVMTRSIDVNRNMWDGQFVVPAAITDDERNAVYQYFAKNSKTMTSETFNYTDFFVQQVYRGTDSYTAKNGGTVVGSNQMNKLMAGSEHVNDFNSGDGSITRVYNGTSSSFSYHNSTDSQYHSEYKVLFVPNYGWYLGFDFCANGQNTNQQVDADGIYTDWILKITPAIKVTTKRIMCEDLGAIGDFDYNDVVFDVLYETDTKARIILRCAGATLDIYIGKFDPAYEVHNLFGVSKGVMVNTARAGLEGNVTSGVVYKTPVAFELEGLSSTNPIDIPIYVGDSESNYALTAEQGAAPHKICVPMDVEWTNERLPISTQYQKFSQWVNNPEVLFWEGVNVWTGEPTPDIEHSGLTSAELEGNALATAVASAISAIETAAKDDNSYNVGEAAQNAKNAINHATTTTAVEVAKNNGLLAIQAAKEANILSADKERAISAIESAAGNDNSNNVREAVQNAKNAINSATSSAAIESAKNAGLSAIQAAKETNVLNTAKESAISAIESAAGNDNSNNVREAVQNAKNAINSATSSDAVESAKNAGLSAIQAAKLVAAKESAIAAIESAAGDDNSNNVKEAAQNAKNTINGATTLDAVESAKNAGLSAIQNAKLNDAKESAIAAIESAAGDDDSDNVKEAVQNAKDAISKATTIDAVESEKEYGLSAIQNAKDENQSQSDGSYGTKIPITTSFRDGNWYSEFRHSDVNSLIKGNKPVTFTCVVYGWCNYISLYFWDTESNVYWHHWTSILNMTKIKESGLFGVYKVYQYTMTPEEYNRIIVSSNDKHAFGGNFATAAAVYVKQ